MAVRHVSARGRPRCDSSVSQARRGRCFVCRSVAVSQNGAAVEPPATGSAGPNTVFVAETLLPTRQGKFRLRGYRHKVRGYLSPLCAMSCCITVPCWATSFLRAGSQQARVTG
jgi:hypothetical protein